MVEQSRNQYLPDYVSPPGETLAETLAAIGMAQAELAERTGRAKKTVNEIIKGKAPISPNIALEFESVLGIPAGFWNSRESQYREYLARKDEQERFQRHLQWLDLFPIREMVKLGWIKGFRDKVQQLRVLLRFFQISSPDQWERYTKAYTDQVAFRKSDAFQSNIPAIIAWLRRGEIEAKEIECAPYDQGKFKKALHSIKSLTTQPPPIFQPQMTRLAAKAGVAVVFVRELPRTRVSAATRWVSPSKAMIQLSLLYRNNDQFWFSFFHEAAHILLHGKRDIFINDQTESGGRKESEANTFAANFLIPSSSFRTLTQTGGPSKKTVIDFSSELGIASGIIVGRLQREQIIPWSFYNDLKVSFKWAKDG
jgi:HTH-type transcriptional regulator / antitoxin HigA